ncbi:MAG TPA: type IV pilus modification protein PilV [Steroidobacter sp.]|jgi:type IV pilus assembly protein PilV|nr:type IV pilus modification protein PilV [Steroidobacter sp.]
MRQHGFSLVEALVALVVLGVGMLGIASLYVVTLRSSGSAISRTQAVNLASDLGDRIRANRKAAEAYAGLATAHDCVSSYCTAQEMAENDLFVWRQQINTALPGDPSGKVEVAAGTPRTFTITVSWTEPGESASSSTYSMRMQL